MKSTLQAFGLAALLMLPAHPWGSLLFLAGCGWQIYRRTPRPAQYLKWSR